MIYHREIYEGEHLKKDDFIRGIGYNTSLLAKLSKKDNTHDYYHEAGISIDGTIRIKREHPLLNKILIDYREGKNSREIIIESIHKHWYYGYYWCLVYRTIGTKSHGVLNYKNENSIDSTILEAIVEIHKNIQFKDKALNWSIF